MPIMIVRPIVSNVHGGLCLFGSICGLKAAVKTSTNGASVHSLLWDAGYLAAAFCMPTKETKSKRALKLAQIILGSLFIAIACAALGSFFFPVGTVIGFLFGIMIGIKGIREWADPETYRVLEAPCPHCGSKVRWMRTKRAFDCSSCKGRLIIIDDKPHTPAEAKTLQKL